jgi:hypothetical protein
MNVHNAPALVDDIISGGYYCKAAEIYGRCERIQLSPVVGDWSYIFSVAPVGRIDGLDCCCKWTQVQLATYSIYMRARAQWRKARNQRWCRRKTHSQLSAGIKPAVGSGCFRRDRACHCDGHSGDF